MSGHFHIKSIHKNLKLINLETLEIKAFFKNDVFETFHFLENNIHFENNIHLETIPYNTSRDNRINRYEGRQWHLSPDEINRSIAYANADR